MIATIDTLFQGTLPDTDLYSAGRAHNHQDPACPLTILIPARDEEAVIGETLDWISAFLDPGDRVHVIADRCTDRTASTAWKHGAIVHVRSAHVKDPPKRTRPGPSLPMLPPPLLIIGSEPGAAGAGSSPDGFTVVGHVFGLRAATGSPAGIGTDPEGSGGFRVPGSGSNAAAGPALHTPGAALKRVLRKLPGCCRAAIRAVGLGLQAHDKPAGESNGTRAPASWSGKAGQPEGKGAALHWWMEQTCIGGDDQEPILILDADSRPAPDLISRLRSLVQEGEQAIQVCEAPMIASSSPAAQPAALSEVVEHRVKDVIRSRLGWPVRLRGTGMLIRRGLLQELSPRLSTHVEDIELTLMLAEKRIPIHYLYQSCVADPKPESAAGAAAQRARWLRGQVRALWVHRRAVSRIMLQGLPGWSLLASIFLKPVTLFSMLKAAACLVCGSVFLLKGSALAGAAGAAAMLSLVFDAGLSLAGLRYLPGRKLMPGAAVGLPSYVLRWLRSTALSLRGVCRRVRPGPAGEE